MTFIRALSLMLLSISLTSPSLLAQESFYFENYSDIDNLFQEYSYTKEAWQEGIREVPRFYLSNIPERWRSTVSQQVSVAVKKEIFFRMLGPLILHANELISSDRSRLENINVRSNMPDQDFQWLAELAERYNVVITSDNEVLAVMKNELLLKVDIIPPSLALAQAAEESGWGTSRFSDLGNALFGQWTWGGNGIVPREQRSGMGDYKIAAFESPQDSIIAYMNNLNTHSAYSDFRLIRADVRAAGQVPRGTDLAESLEDYSERGLDYVETLRIIIRVNKLAMVDDAYLSDDPHLFLVPVGEGNE